MQPLGQRLQPLALQQSGLQGQRRSQHVAVRVADGIEFLRHGVGLGLVFPKLQLHRLQAVLRLQILLGDGVERLDVGHGAAQQQQHAQGQRRNPGRQRHVQRKACGELDKKMGCADGGAVGEQNQRIEQHRQHRHNKRQQGQLHGVDHADNHIHQIHCGHDPSAVLHGPQAHQIEFLPQKHQLRTAGLDTQQAGGRPAIHRAVIKALIPAVGVHHKDKAALVDGDVSHHAAPVDALRQTKACISGVGKAQHHRAELTGGGIIGTLAGVDHRFGLGKRLPLGQCHIRRHGLAHGHVAVSVQQPDLFGAAGYIDQFFRGGGRLRVHPEIQHRAKRRGVGQPDGFIQLLLLAVFAAGSLIAQLPRVQRSIHVQGKLLVHHADVIRHGADAHQQQSQQREPHRHPRPSGQPPPIRLSVDLGRNRTLLLSGKEKLHTTHPPMIV